jgi:hypothetical protein
LTCERNFYRDSRTRLLFSWTRFHMRISDFCRFPAGLHLCVVCVRERVRERECVHMHAYQCVCESVCMRTYIECVCAYIHTYIGTHNISPTLTHIPLLHAAHQASASPLCHTHNHTRAHPLSLSHTHSLSLTRIPL